MAVGTGYSKVATTGLVFAYDQGDTYNSYKGEPTTNYWNGNQFSIYNDGATNVRNSTDVAPPVPGYEVVKVTANNIGTYGQCILWNATYPNNNVATITNSIYAYLTVGDYVQVGQHWWPWYYGTQKYIAKNQWVRISETYNINEGNSYGNAALTYSTNGIAYFAMPQFEYISHVTPFIGANQTRSSSQGLLDVSGRGTTIPLSNSYDSNALFYFDGTDDQIVMDSNASVVPTAAISVEAIVKPLALSTNRVFVAYGGNSNDQGFLLQFENSSGIGFAVFNTPSTGMAYLGLNASQQYLNQYVYMVGTYDGSVVRYYVNGAQVALANYSSGYPAQSTFRIGNEFNRSYYANAYIPVSKVYNRALSATEIKQNYDHYKTRYSMPAEVYHYYEGANAAPFVGNWNNSTTYTMANFGGIPNVTAHGWSSGPATYTLTLNNLPKHTKVRYRVYWHLVDSLDNETNQLFIMNSAGSETEILRFTKQYNLVPNISVLDTKTSAKWSGGQTYTYRPWAGGAYGQDGYLIVDSGLQDHTSNSFTARHVLGADQAQADEAEYLSHVEVLLY